MSRRYFGLFLTAACLYGCTSFSGSPEPLLSGKSAAYLVRPYSPDKAIEQLSHYQDEDERRVYRDRVVAAYLAAIDGRYLDFRRNLSKTKKGWGVALDTATLGLTGGASILRDAAQSLAAGATAVAGTRASLDRELFSEKTLPAIVALMDSNRLAVRGDIQRGLSLPENAYTLHAAFADLMRYEAAASVDAAITQTAALAANEARQVQYDYSKALTLCTPPPALASQRSSLMIGIEAFEKAAEAPGADAPALRKSIQAAAIAAGDTGATLATDRAAAFAQLSAIRNYLQAICTQATFDAFKARLMTAGVIVP